VGQIRGKRGRGKTGLKGLREKDIVIQTSKKVVDWRGGDSSGRTCRGARGEGGGGAPKKARKGIRRIRLSDSKKKKEKGIVGEGGGDDNQLRKQGGRTLPLRGKVSGGQEKALGGGGRDSCHSASATSVLQYKNKKKKKCPSFIGGEEGNKHKGVRTKEGVRERRARGRSYGGKKRNQINFWEKTKLEKPL